MIKIMGDGRKMKSFPPNSVPAVLLMTFIQNFKTYFLEILKYLFKIRAKYLENEEFSPQFCSWSLFNDSIKFFKTYLLKILEYL